MELTVWLGLLASALFISISPGPGLYFQLAKVHKTALREH